MSGVYINGQMPKNCCYCPCMHWEATQDARCYAVEDDGNGSTIIAEDVDDRDLLDLTGKIKTPDWCPLVEVPDHGDLIDKGALVHDINFNVSFFGLNMKKQVLGAMKIIERILAAPVVIQGNKEEEK